MKGKLIVILFCFYGLFVAIAYHFHNMVAHESGFYFLNMFVEDYVIVPALLHYANELGTPLLGNDLLALRIFSSVVFWGGIALLVYCAWWSVKTLILLKTETAEKFDDF